MGQRTLGGRWSACARLLVLVAAAAVVGCHYDEYVVSAAPAPFTIRELGLLPGGTQSQASAGSQTAIVGWGIVAGSARHAVTFSGGQAHALPEPAGATASEARGVNSAGVVVGFATIGGTGQGVVWPSATAAPVLLPTLAGPYTLAGAINEEGIVLGQSATSAGDTVLVTWTPNGGTYSVDRIRARTVTHTGTDSVVDTVLVGAGYAPTAINNLGQIVGNLPADSETSGFIWKGESLTLDTIEAPGNRSTDANGFNNFGVVVGAFTVPSGQSRAFLFTGALGAFQLGGPPSGYTDIEANAVNDSGRVSGNAFTADNAGNPLTSVAVIGTMIDSVHTFTALPTLGGGLAHPVDNAITQCGVVLGWATKTGAAAPRYAVAWVPQGCTIP